MKAKSSPHVVLLDWRDPWHPETGGAQTYAYQVARHLVHDGIHVTWVTSSYDGAARDETRDGIRFVRRGGRLSVFPRATALLRSRVLGHYDAVLEVQNGMPFFASLATRKPVAILVHHVHREQWSVVGAALAKIGWWLESKAAVRANRGRQYVAVSDTTRRDLIGLGVRGDDIRLAWNGTPDVPDFTPRPRATVPTIVVLSRLVPHKQIEHTIDLLPALHDQFGPVELRIMGDGWWMEALQQHAAAVGVADSTHFLGHVDEVTKFEELSAAWVHVLPSIKEGWGIAIIEAALTGTPSVAYTSAGGVGEAILDGVTGLLAADGELGARVAELIGNDELRTELGEKAAIRADELTWASTTTRIRGALGL